MHQDQGGRGMFQRPFRVRQPLIRGIPAQQPAEEPHIRTLRLVGRGQGTIAVELHETLLQFAAHQVQRQPPDPQRRRTVGTRRAAHDGPEHVIEDAHDHARILLTSLAQRDR